MNAHDEDRIKQLIRSALPPAEPGPEPAHDLWPAVLRRLDRGPASGWPALHWFDGALLAGLVVFAVAFPATIPVFLYYL